MALARLISIQSRSFPLHFALCLLCGIKTWDATTRLDPAQTRSGPGADSERTRRRLGAAPGLRGQDGVERERDGGVAGAPRARPDLRAGRGTRALLYKVAHGSNLDMNEMGGCWGGLVPGLVIPCIFHAPGRPGRAGPGSSSGRTRVGHGPRPTVTARGPSRSSAVCRPPGGRIYGRRGTASHGQSRSVTVSHGHRRTVPHSEPDRTDVQVLVHTGTY